MKNKCHLRKKSKEVPEQIMGNPVFFFSFLFFLLKRRFSNTRVLICSQQHFFLWEETQTWHRFAFALVSQEIKWGQKHITQLCRDDGKCPSRSPQRIREAIKAPLTNHSGKNACHFPTSGTDSVGSQVCDLSSLQTERNLQVRCPKQTVAGCFDSCVAASVYHYFT